MREEDFRRFIRPVFQALEETGKIIGSAGEVIKDKNSYYYSVTTLLDKNYKRSSEVVNIIVENTGREPEIYKKDGFSYYKWEYFIK